MQIKSRISGAAIFAVLMFASRAGATEVLTNTYTNWLTTVSDAASEWNFSIPNNTYNTAAGYNLSLGSYGPINVTGPDGSGYNLTKNPGYGSSNLISLAGPSDGVGSMVFTTPSAGLTAFALGLGVTGNTSPITVTLSDGEVLTANPTVNGTVFFGLSSATPITSFILSTSSGSQVILDDFMAADSNEPPAPTAPAGEVATVIMIGSGLLFLGGYRKVFSNVSAAEA